MIVRVEYPVLDFNDLIKKVTHIKFPIRSSIRIKSLYNISQVKKIFKILKMRFKRKLHTKHIKSGVPPLFGGKVHRLNYIDFLNVLLKSVVS